MQWTTVVLIAVASYLAGSIPTGYLLARLKGVDIRKTGSGNIGATNVFRILGKGAGITVLLVDALKGFLPVQITHMTLQGSGSAAEGYAMVAGFFAIIGHNYTCWLRFKGGKGIATSAGVLIGLAPWALLVTLGVWLGTFALSKYVSLASVMAAVALPFATWGMGGSLRMVALTTILSLLAIYKHRANIQRLLNGTEHRFGKKQEPV